MSTIESHPLFFFANFLRSIVYRNPVYHQVAFGTLAISTAFMIRHLLKWSEVRFRIPDEKKSQIGNIFGYGAGLFLLGFLVWNLDNIFCDGLTRFKVSIGWPLAFLFEGHAWWHVLTVRSPKVFPFHLNSRTYVGPGHLLHVHWYPS